jgi:hypothetical protein
MKISNITTLAALLLLIGFSQESLARDLGGAANAYVSSILPIAKKVTLGGVLAGGGMMCIPGGAFLGRTILSGSVLGSVIVYGAPTLFSFLGNVFGA